MALTQSLSGQVNVSGTFVQWDPFNPPPTGYENGIYIAPGTTLLISHSILEMNQDAQIYLHYSSRLLIYMSQITSSDPVNNVYWGGIYAYGDMPLLPGASLPEQFASFPDPRIQNDVAAWEGVINDCNGCVNPFDKHSYIYTENAEISHAKVGIESNWGAIVRCRNTDFFNNETSVYIHDYTSILQPYVNACYFMDCNFKWDKNNPNFNQTDLVGIKLKDVRGVQIGGCQFIYDEKDQNEDYVPYCVNERGVGISSLNALFGVSTSGNTYCWDDMGCLKNCYVGSPGNFCEFSNLSIGVNCQANVGNGFIITNSIFNNNHKGVIASQNHNTLYGYLKVFDCNFNGNREILDQIFEDDMSDCYTNNYLIEDVYSHKMIFEAYRNSFSFNGDNINHINSVTSRGRIMSNEFYNFESATTAADNATGVNVVGNNSNMIINCNTFTDLGTDIKINNGATVKNPMHGKDPSLAASNIFSDPLTGRYRIDNNSSNSSITYMYTGLNQINNSQFPGNSPNSNNVTTTQESSFDCNLVCEELISDNGYGLNVAQIEFNNKLLIYPNPTDRKLNIQIKNGKFIQSASLINMQGVTIYSKIDLNDESFQINTHNLANGIYLIQVLTTENELLTAKVIVNH